MTAVMHHEPTDAELIGAALRTSEAQAPSLTTITVPSVDELQRVLTNALLAAQSETARDNRPPLQCVHLEITDGHLEIVTTDSYRMMHQEPCQDPKQGAGECWDVTGPDIVSDWTRDDLAPVLALAKATKGRDRDRPVVVTLGHTGRLELTTPTTASPRRLVMFAGGITCTIRDASADWSFPSWRVLVPADEKLTGTAHPVGFNPRFLADLAKYRAPRLKAGEGTVKVRTQDHLKPALFTLSAEAWYLLMPVRAA